MYHVTFRQPSMEVLTMREEVSCPELQLHNREAPDAFTKVPLGSGTTPCVDDTKDTILEAE